MLPPSSIPLTLLTGFLGSGKTTLLNRLLHDPALAGCAVLINEVGEVGLDHLLVERPDEDVVLLESGCLCCSVRGDLMRALRELLQRIESGRLTHLDRVIVETTGLADPAPVIHTLMHNFELARHFRLDGVITTLDPLHAAWQTAQYPEAQRQLALADRIVLSKCDIARPEQIAEALTLLDVLSPTAAIFRSDELPAADELLSGMALHQSAHPAAQTWLATKTSPKNAQGGLALGAKSSPHSSGVATHLLRFDAPFKWETFAAAIDMLLQAAGSRILRLKGLISIEDDASPHVLHAVHDERYPDSRLPAWPDASRETRLVFITQDLPREALVQAIETLFERSPLAA